MKGLVAPGRATVRAAAAPMHADPFVASVQVSQRLAGHDVELLDQQDDWFLVRGLDGYEGWMHHGFLVPAGDNGSGRSRGRISLGCVVRSSDGTTRRLPLGAWLASDDQVRSGDVVTDADLRARFPTGATAITDSALALFEGTPYLWGGVTPWGADCSGFVQSIYWLHGIQLPRDAWQQSGSGRDAGTLLSLEAADLAFFSDREDRRVTHVAIALGDHRLVHLALGRGGYAVEDLDDDSDAYVVKLKDRFLRARRVLDSARV